MTGCRNGRLKHYVQSPPQGQMVGEMVVHENRRSYAFWRDPQGAPPGQVRCFRTDTKKENSRVPFRDLPPAAQTAFLHFVGVSDEKQLA